MDVVDDVVDDIDNEGITIDSSDVRGSRPSNFLEKLPLKASSLLLKTFWIICWSVLEIFTVRDGRERHNRSTVHLERIASYSSSQDNPLSLTRRNHLTGLIMWSVVALAIGVVRVTIAHTESFTVAPSLHQQHQHRSNSAGSSPSISSSSSAVTSISSSSSSSSLSSSSLSSDSSSISFLPPLRIPPSSQIQFHNEALFDWEDRVHRYCAQPAYMSSSEGRIPIWSPSSSSSSSSSISNSTTSSPPPVTSMKLVQAIVLIRHGDRSAIHRLPSESTVAGAPATWTCGKPDVRDAEWAGRVLKPFTSTSECIIETDGDDCLHLEALSLKEAMEEGTAPIPADGDVARHALGLKNAKDSSDSKCSSTRGGELTSLGWAQHRAIGAELGAYGSVDAYRELLFRKDDVNADDKEENEKKGTSSVWKRKALVASTTDYGRTALSLQAFVMGLLKGPESNDNNEESGNVVNTRDTADLPGLGPLPIPLHIVQRSLDHSLWSKGPPAGMCPRSEAYVALDKELLSVMARLPTDVSNAISGITKKSESELPGDEETADAMLCRICHGISLPCWTEAGEREGGGGGGGETSSFSSESSKEAEEVLAIASGRCLTQSQASQIVMRADAIYSVRSASRATRLNTYPILSDIVKTLRQAADKRENSPRFVVRAGHDTVVAPILASLGAVDGPFAWPGFASRIVLELWEASTSSPSSSSVASEYLVRMTMNGEDVTKRLSCSAANPEQSYCTLDEFASLVDQLIAPSSSWAEACAQPVQLEEEEESASSTVRMMSVSAAASAVPVS